MVEIARVNGMNGMKLRKNNRSLALYLKNSEFYRKMFYIKNVLRETVQLCTTYGLSDNYCY